MMALSIPDILTTKQRRLAKLEQQAAQLGYDTPPQIANEIEDLRRELTPAAPANEAERYATLERKVDRLGDAVMRLHWLIPILMMLYCILLIVLVKL